MESINIKIGSELPRQHLGQGGNDSWRSSPITNEAVWRSLKFKNSRDDYATFELSTQEKEEMITKITHEINRNWLQDLARYAIILYLIIPILLTVCVTWLITIKDLKNKIVLAVTIALLSASFYFLLSREVFTAVFAD